MIYSLENDILCIKINSAGGELWSIKDKDNTEYLWQGDTEYWEDRAPNLFPYIARLTQERYILNGKVYKMGIHGFLKDSELSLRYMNKSKIVFSLKSNNKTFQQYPYKFDVRITYKLTKNQLEVHYSVRNKDSKKMFFGVGGHPGFNVPFEKGLKFEDYYIQFKNPENIERVEMSEDCFVLGKYGKFEFDQQDKINLHHDMFRDDAIILRNASRRICLRSDKGKKALEIENQKMDFLGIWHMPNTDAPYVCLEPWSSLPSRKGIIEELEKQENLICLKQGGYYSSFYKIRITG